MLVGGGGGGGAGNEVNSKLALHVHHAHMINYIRSPLLYFPMFFSLMGGGWNEADFECAHLLH